MSQPVSDRRTQTGKISFPGLGLVLSRGALGFRVRPSTGLPQHNQASGEACLNDELNKGKISACVAVLNWTAGLKVNPESFALYAVSRLGDESTTDC